LFQVKRLMLGHVFTFVDTVIFWGGHENWRSQGAKTKIGDVKREGLFSREPSRDTPYFILDNEGSVSSRLTLGRSRIDRCEAQAGRVRIAKAKTASAAMGSLAGCICHAPEMELRALLPCYPYCYRITHAYFAVASGDPFASNSLRPLRAGSPHPAWCLEFVICSASVVV
jgi:hypothetical protein